jgi:small subunit ribosomal protein S9
MAIIKVKKNTISNKDKYVEGLGRRKTSVARVRIIKGGRHSFIINGKPLIEYFSIKELANRASQPLECIDNSDKLLITVVVYGGGITSQADAVCLGLARALVKREENLKPKLKQKKLLTRDARIKERRKFGLKKARKAPQWSKR